MKLSPFKTITLILGGSILMLTVVTIIGNTLASHTPNDSVNNQFELISSEPVKSGVLDSPIVIKYRKDNMSRQYVDNKLAYVETVKNVKKNVVNFKQVNNSTGSFLAGRKAETVIDVQRAPVYTEQLDVKNSSVITYDNVNDFLKHNPDAVGKDLRVHWFDYNYVATKNSPNMIDSGAVPMVPVVQFVYQNKLMQLSFSSNNEDVKTLQEKNYK